MKAATMNAIVYQQYGSPEVLQWEQVAKPTPKPNQILVKIHATTVTSGDWRMRQANPFLVRLFNGIFKPKNQILGTELAGEVEAVGEKVSKYKVGDRIFGYQLFGTYAEYICLDENSVITQIPEGMSYQEAASVPNGALSAHFFLKQAHIKPGQKVLIIGASGSVGAYAVQLAREAGAEVTAVCSSRNVEMVRQLGAQHIIDYTQEEFTERDTRYDVIFDAVDKSTFVKCEPLLNEQGVFLTTGFTFEYFWKMFKTSGKNYQGKRVVVGNAESQPEDLEMLRVLLQKGSLQAVLDRTYHLQQAAEAHRYVQAGHKRGNVVLQVMA